METYSVGEMVHFVRIILMIIMEPRNMREYVSNFQDNSDISTGGDHTDLIHGQNIS